MNLHDQAVSARRHGGNQLGPNLPALRGQDHADAISPGADQRGAIDSAETSAWPFSG